MRLFLHPSAATKIPTVVLTLSSTATFSKTPSLWVCRWTGGVLRPSNSSDIPAKPNSAYRHSEEALPEMRWEMIDTQTILLRACELRVKTRNVTYNQQHRTTSKPSTSRGAGDNEGMGREVLVVSLRPWTRKTHFQYVCGVTPTNHSPALPKQISDLKVSLRSNPPPRHAPAHTQTDSTVCVGRVRVRVSRSHGLGAPGKIRHTHQCDGARATQPPLTATLAATL